jgi:4-diphosphocytidyl-2-C-methyl-D-erythritol kinase
MLGALSEAAPAKINLFLHVIGRRADGYHLLDSLAVFPDVGDVLHAGADATLSLAIGGPFAGALAGEGDNLVLRAAGALAAARGVCPAARLVLEKNLPVASGIGGGSADAAAALRLLARLWGVAPADTALAAALGADVPVCLAGRAARMGGVGDVLSSAPVMPACGLVLVNPGIGVSTPLIFAARSGDFSAPARLPLGWTEFAAFAADLERLGNDLEAPALRLCPSIGTSLAALRAQPGCALARMSGSGATCFGLFANAAAADVAASALRRPGWWSWGGALAGVAARRDAT